MHGGAETAAPSSPTRATEPAAAAAADAAAGEEREGEVAWTSTFALAGQAQVHTLLVEGETDLNAALIRLKQELIRKLEGLLLAAVTGLRWWLVAQVDVSRPEPGNAEGASPPPRVRCQSAMKKSLSEAKVRPSFPVPMRSENRWKRPF